MFRVLITRSTKGTRRLSLFEVLSKNFNEDSINPVRHQFTYERRRRLKDFDKERVDLQEKYDSVLDEIRDNEIVVNLLKDSGIKTQIVRKYLPVMNKFIRKYLSDLELDIHFTLDEEFNEKVSSPMYQDFSYASFSEGQKSRIDLTLMLTWERDW